MKVEFDHHRIVEYRPGNGPQTERVMLPLFEAQRMSREGSGTILPRGGATVCNIIGESGSVLGAGRANCSRRDNFCRKIGRKIALDRAAHAAGLRARDVLRTLRSEAEHRERLLTEVRPVPEDAPY